MVVGDEAVLVGSAAEDEMVEWDWLAAPKSVGGGPRA